MGFRLTTPLQKLCELFNCKPGDLLEYVPIKE
ncbi:MAG: helix-turn-helix domain-containing protein [Betaproteobacteria bacterium]|nr:helix-turn-helix domain-containing protein [Betaproteobacteria bacterium]